MLPTRIWQIYYTAVFRMACVLSAFIKLPLDGTLVAIWHRGRILLVRKSYQKGWSIPGGLRKKGESWQETAVRETLEEVGMRLCAGALSFVAEVTGDLGNGNRTRLFEIDIDESLEIQVDGKEIVCAEFVTVDQALKRDLGKHIRPYLTGRFKRELQ